MEPPLAFSSAAPSSEQGPAVARGENGQTLATLFHREESGLLRFAIGLVRRRDVAEELVQDAFVRLHEVWSEVENPRGWLYRTLRNLALNHLRDHARETTLDESTHLAEDELPAEKLAQMEAVGLVKMLLAEMNESDRKLVGLKYLENLKYGEISRRTGLSVSNVGYRLHHLLKHLADGLRRAGIEGSRR